jgi:hypothetical protein
LVEVPPELVAIVADEAIAARLQDSSPVGFGSEKLPDQYATWASGSRVTDAMVPMALGTLMFDAVIENADRRRSNPNCLAAGERFWLIDHEAALPSVLIGWTPPWQNGGLAWLDQADGHIFFSRLKGRHLDFQPISEVWSQVTDARLQAYRAAIPPEWNEALPIVEGALERIRNARNNLDGIIAELARVLQ